jgi:hypothetical protein
VKENKIKAEEDYNTDEYSQEVGDKKSKENRFLSIKEVVNRIGDKLIPKKKQKQMLHTSAIAIATNILRNVT